MSASAGYAASSVTDSTLIVVEWKGTDMIMKYATFALLCLIILMPVQVLVPDVPFIPTLFSAGGAAIIAFVFTLAATTLALLVMSIFGLDEDSQWGTDVTFVVLVVAGAYTTNFVHDFSEALGTLAGDVSLFLWAGWCYRHPSKRIL